MSQGRPKSGSTGAGDKLVIFVHFFALLLTPPTVLILKRVLKTHRYVLSDYSIEKIAGIRILNFQPVQPKGSSATRAFFPIFQSQFLTKWNGFTKQLIHQSKVKIIFLY